MNNANMGYQQNPGMQPGYVPPPMQLVPRYSLLKLIFLGIITCGIYVIYAMSKMGEDLNTIASRFDNRKTMHFCLLVFLISPITCGIASLVWYHNISDRIGNELRRRGIQYSFGSGSFWGWYILGSFIIVGPFIYLHKLCSAMNLLINNYNSLGY